MPERRILVFGEKEFQITVPDGAKVTFGPWSPSSMKESRYGQSDAALRGTLRIYQGSKSTENIIAVFSGVRGFRDLSLDYMEKVAVKEGNAMWRSDKNGYVEERKEKGRSEWVPSDKLLETSEDTEEDETPF